MSEKLFVIMEVKEVETPNPIHGFHFYRPMDDANTNVDCGNLMRLDPSRIIPASRLRYGAPKNEDTVFLDNFWDWTTNFNSHLQYLILDPEPEQDEWEKWADEGRELMDLESFPQKFEDWLKRMPRK